MSAANGVCARGGWWEPLSHWLAELFWFGFLTERRAFFVIEKKGQWKDSVMTPCITIECCAEEKKTEKSSPHWERKEKTAVNDQLCTSFLDGRLRVKAYEHRLCDWLRRISISSLKVIRAAFAHAMNESESSPSSFPGYAVSSTFASSSAFDSSTAQRFWSPV